MFLGRNTVQWTALISAIVSGFQIIGPILWPQIDPVSLATILGTAGIMLGAVIVFVANTSTTPSGDPQLKEGTMIRVTDDAGTVIGHTPVPTPVSPPTVISSPATPTDP